MAEPRDVIVSAFATPPGALDVAGVRWEKSDLAQPRDIFVEEPIIIGVDATLEEGEGFYDKAFGREAARWRDEQGSILRRFLASHLRGIEVRRIALVGFSAGGVFLSKVIASPDAAFVDTVILLDALHLMKAWEGDPSFLAESIGPWANFGVRAGRAEDEGAGPLMVMAHTSIATPSPLVGSTSASAAAVSSQVIANTPGAVRTGYDASLLLAGPPPPSVTLGPAQGLPPPAKTFSEIPAPTGVGRGNYHAYGFGGTSAADHAFVAWLVQGALWRTFLAPRWNAGLDCGPPPVAGLGQTFCGPQGVIVPPGTYAVPDSPHWGWALAGFAAGGIIGYAGTRAIGKSL